MQDCKIEVGDRVTFENYEGILVTMLICNNTDITEMKEILETRKLIKIERPTYTVIKDKELLTEGEKEFLKDILKYYEVKYIFFQDEDMSLSDKDYHILACIEYPKALNFENLEGKNYSLSELGLEE